MCGCPGVPGQIALDADVDVDANAFAFASAFALVAAVAFFGSTCLPNDLCISPILPSTFPRATKTNKQARLLPT